MVLLAYPEVLGLVGQDRVEPQALVAFPVVLEVLQAFQALAAFPVVQVVLQALLALEASLVELEVLLA